MNPIDMVFKGWFWDKHILELSFNTDAFITHKMWFFEVFLDFVNVFVINVAKVWVVFFTNMASKVWR